MFCKKNVPKDFAIFTDLQLYEKETLPPVFSCECCKIFKNNYFENTANGCFWTYITLFQYNFIMFSKNTTKIFQGDQSLSESF